jgi:hypothetical protein
MKKLSNITELVLEHHRRIRKARRTIATIERCIAVSVPKIPDNEMAEYVRISESIINEE